jgi:phosphopantetheinyl transferase (holo-ACP synthase)
MKLATGVDLIEIARIEEVSARHGKHYLERIFTPAELEAQARGHVGASVGLDGTVRIPRGCPLLGE